MINLIIKELKYRKSKNVSIVAGHYCLSKELAELNSNQAAEETSLKFGIKVYQALSAIGYQCSFILFINDIGIDIKERNKIKKKLILPKNYLDILLVYSFDVSNIDIWLESSLRNKASKLIRKAKKNNKNIVVKKSQEPGLTRCIENTQCDSIINNKEVVTIAGKKRGYLVIKEGSNPKCNAILATLYKDIQESKGSDFNINVFNSIYINRIALGKYVYEKLFNGSMKQMDFFTDEQKVSQRECI